MVFKLPTHKWMPHFTEKVPKMSRKVSAHIFSRFLKVFSDLIFKSRKAFKALINGVKRVYCSVAYLWDFRHVPRMRVRFVPRFAILTFRSCPNQKCFPWQKKKMLEKFFFVGEAPLACYGTFQEQFWQHADNFQVCTRTFFSCPFFGFSERRDFPAHFSVWENVVANVGILRLFPNGIMSCHVISCHVRSRTHAQRVVA